MIKRVFAWILLLGFVLLLLNIMIFHYYLIQSIVIYLVIAIWFVFANKPLSGRKDKNSPDKNNDENDNNSEL